MKTGVKQKKVFYWGKRNGLQKQERDINQEGRASSFGRPLLVTINLFKVGREEEAGEKRHPTSSGSLAR